MNILAEAIKVSFDNWISRDDKFRRLGKKMTQDMYSLLHAGFSEVTNYKPATFNLWFIMNHMRFKTMRQEDKTLVNELAYNFLTKYIRNELEQTNRKTRTKKAKPT